MDVFTACLGRPCPTHPVRYLQQPQAQLRLSDSIKIVEAGWSAPSNVRALTTLRHGGVSSGRFASLNLGLHVGDDETAVLENRALLRAQLELPREPVWLQQTHSTRVVELSEQSQLVSGACDGTYTVQRGVVCAVMTADCLPLFLTNQAGTKVALLHVGWRGLADGIIAQGLAALAEPADHLIAWAGPCIGPHNFEIGAEVREALGGPASAYRASSRDGKWYADLYQLTGDRLRASGIHEYSHAEDCTHRDKAAFFSHRRDQGTGRMVSLLWME